ncbi:hypothetical protein QVD17_08696 [Tagetes erecta]|uniref:F-box associated beta-propeller type 3 domain-containing protein n=1 Tax=Tagetes erecta TaxID=13708 RepID=A0AAD8L312_TARER|nr:hypothetical protein QVD17_08696 [Tagetes erecta]
MVDLSVEINVSEILTRVPAKVVGRSKCVCKEWCALLSTQEFLRVHANRSLNSSNQRILFVGDHSISVHPINVQSGVYGPSTIVSFPFNDISIHSHLNGLLCLHLNNTSELLLWNPITRAYKHLSKPDCHGFFEHNSDTIGLYMDAYDDYKVLHVKRRCRAFVVSIYSRKIDSWRNIHFITEPEYVNPTFSWSTGTLCCDTLYFTVCECYVGGKNVVICFDVNSEEVKEIGFPPVPSTGFYYGDVINVKNKLHMFLSTGKNEILIDLWMLENECWKKVFSCPPVPPISLSIWCNINHFMTNGNWFMMTLWGKLYEIETDEEPFECFYHTHFRNFSGAMFVQTIVSPSL